MTYQDHYGFGKNWQRFIDRYYSRERLDAAMRSLSDFLDVERLDGRSFMDIGCGSGLFSYAAHELGASPVTSFDVDDFSVACCRSMWERAGRPEDWRVLSGSVLDREFVSALPKAGVVYSWGVLHHTGAMWEAIECAASRVAPGGLFYIALYGRVGGFMSSERWLAVKKFYNRLPGPGQWAMDWAFMMKDFVVRTLTGNHPIRTIREYPATGRGMSYRTDVSDWLGGYPYEFVTVDEVVSFCEDRLGLETVKVLERTGGANHEFVFRRA